MPLRPVTTWYLEMRDRAAHARAPSPDPAASLVRAEIPSPALNRFLYTSVGGDWHWVDRLPWTWAQWMNWLDTPDVQTWVLYLRGTPAGYCELQRQAAGDVEIAYFGLLPQFTGRGLGKYLLSETIERAWDMGAQRVWVHTCSLDHASALANYKARGMTQYKEVTVMKDVPEQTPGPWPGAQAPEAKR